MKRMIIFCFVLIIVLPFVNSAAIGISPAYHKFFFEPNLEKELTFYVSSSEPGQIIEIYVLGDLAEYVDINPTRIIGKGNLVVSLKLPEKIDIPGKHRILIGVLEGGNLDESKIKQGVGGIVAVQAPIDILVPYPGKYAEAKFNIESINVGEKAKFNFEINNLGTKEITAEPKIEIFDSEGGKLLTEIFGPETLKSKIVWNYEDELDTSNFEPGIYSAVMSFDYGKLIRIENVFKVGYLFVDIVNYSYQFDKGKINKFDIEVENLWNLPIGGVHVGVGVTDNGTVVDKFNTPTVDLNAWEKKTLTGFFDASDIEDGRYLASITVHYENETNNKLVAIYVNKVLMDMRLVIAIAVAGLFVLLSAGLIVYLTIRIKKLKRLNRVKYGKKEKK